MSPINAANDAHFGPHHYEVRHKTTYEYDDDVTTSFSRAVLRLRDTPFQKVSEDSVDVVPEPEVLVEHTDFFGNRSHYIEIQTPHRNFEVSKRAVVAIDFPRLQLTQMDFSVAEAVARLDSDPLVDPVERAVFTLPSDLVSLGSLVQDFARTLVWPDRLVGEAIEAVFQTIFTDFKYSKGATTVRTTLEQIIEAKAGVCQDFAHLAVACFRCVGLPARYVSGYIETYPPPGKPKLAGSDATHAWASVLVPGFGWVDLDPTNNHLADSRYITAAWGRDFRDVSPLKGVMFTESQHSSLQVGVDVIRLDEPS